LVCSLYTPTNVKKYPCVIYLHCNTGNRVEANNIIDVLLPKDIAVLSFDFAGCGNSEGEFISLGWYEAEDLKLIVNWIKKRKKITKIGLWGRSMGAVTALLYTGLFDRDFSALVLDSPFSCLKELALDMISEKTGFPRLLSKPVFSYIQYRF